METPAVSADNNRDFSSSDYDRTQGTVVGLQYFRARYFDANLGRFISRDPMGYVDGASQYRAYFIPGGIDPTGRKEITLSDKFTYTTSSAKIDYSIGGPERDENGNVIFESGTRYIMEWSTTVTVKCTEDCLPEVTPSNKVEYNLGSPDAGFVPDSLSFFGMANAGNRVVVSSTAILADSCSDDYKGGGAKMRVVVEWQSYVEHKLLPTVKGLDIGDGVTVNEEITVKSRATYEIGVTCCICTDKTKSDYNVCTESISEKLISKQTDYTDENGGNPLPNPFP
jgi:RHS repeat-associated protein